MNIDVGNILSKCILIEIFSLAKNDIDREISFDENDIDRDISLANMILTERVDNWI